MQQAKNYRDVGEGGGVTIIDQEGGSSGRVMTIWKGPEIDGSRCNDIWQFAVEGNILSEIEGWVVHM